MRNLADQRTGSVTQCVIMLKLDGKFNFKSLLYIMVKEECSAHFDIAVK